METEREDKNLENQVNSEQSSNPGEPELEPSMGFLGRATGILHEPVMVIRDIHRKPDWLLPFILILALTALYVFIAGDVLQNFAIEQASTSMQKNVDRGNMTQEQVDAILEQQEKFIGIGIYVNTLLSVPVVRLLLAVALLFFGNIILGGSNKFKQYWSLALYGGIIAALGTVITGIIIAMKGDVFGARLGLSIIAQDTDSLLFKITSAFNIFLIWEAIIMGLGLSEFSQKPRSNGIIIMLIIYMGMGVASAYMIPG